MIIRRRGLEEEQSAPTPSYEVHTVTTKCTNTKACADYFKTLGTSGAKGFFWIRDGASSIINNHLIYYLLNGSSNVGRARWRNSAMAAVTIASNYDGIINVGDKFLVVDFAYNSEIYCPSNMGVSVTETTASVECVNTQEVQNMIPALPNVVFPKKIDAKNRTVAFVCKAANIRMNGSDAIQGTTTGTSYEMYLSQGAPLWIVKYN